MLHYMYLFVKCNLNYKRISVQDINLTVIQTIAIVDSHDFADKIAQLNNTHIMPVFSIKR